MTKRKAKSIYRKDLQLIGKTLANWIKKEWRDQGHRASGKLIKSVKSFVADLLKDTEIQITHRYYGRFQEKGIKPSAIPYSRGSGKKTSKFIDALIEWIKLKRIAGGLFKDIRSMAFAVATNMKKEGMPTSGSFKFSKNGRRTGAIRYVTRVYKNEITEDIQSSLLKLFENYRNAIFDSLKKRYESFV